MARRVVRDIEKKGPATIVLRDEPLKEELSHKKELLDVSGRKPRAGVRPRAIRDIGSAKEAAHVMFFRVNDEEEKKADRLGEALRIAAAGTLILVALNTINIYQRGITLKSDLIASATTGYEELVQAGDQAVSANFGAAEITFDEAYEYFASALKSVSFLRVNQQYFFTREKTFESVQGLLEAAQNIAGAGKNFARGVQNLQQVPALFIQENSAASQQSGKRSLTEKLKEDLVYVDTALDQLKTAQQNLTLVSSDVLPPTFREKLSSARTKLEKLNEVLTTTRQKIPALLELLGDRYPHRYLILLQNDTEARPTGGFIGSYVIADLNDGYLTKMDFHDVYELDGQLQEYIEPPEDIARVTDNWRMRDSNYSPDFAISAEKAAWFLQKQKGPSVDTVIAINQSFIGDLLTLTGPLPLGSLNAPLDQDNFQLILSYVIESKLSGIHNPKEIMAELVPAFQKKLLQEAPLSDILSTMAQGIHDKKILFYSRNERVQELFDELGMTPRVQTIATDEDYLNVAIASIGGNKSDRFIDQTIKHFTLIHPDGTIVNEVTITRKHTWNEKDLEGWKAMLKRFGFNDLPPHIQDILGAGENRVFVKLYIPKGSELLSVNGTLEDLVLQKTYEEIGKKYFMIQMNTKAGTENTMSVTYKLPYKLELLPADAYKLHVQTAPAIRSSYFEKKVFFKPGLKSYREYPGGFAKDESGYLEYAGVLAGDLYLSTLVGN